MKRILSWTAAGLIVAPLLAEAAEVRIALPQERTNFQTNETINLAVVRSDAADLAAGTMSVNLSGQDGSKLAFTFPTAAVQAADGKAVATEHVNIAGQLLRPGAYTIEVQADGASASATINVFSHVRRSTFRVINWGSPKTAEDQQIQGEWSLGYNLMYSAGGVGSDKEGDFIAAGVDQMAVCIMSGGHQMDLRMECDWSDPLVVRGGTRRATREALNARLRGNSPGVNFYDEPGLTWRPNDNGQGLTPHGVPSQLASYEAAFGKPMIEHTKVDPNNPEHVAQWEQWGDWKLGFMEAAWRDAVFAVAQVDPTLISATQSQYGWTAFTDGYYFNVARSLPITSGHGGYDDLGFGYLFPSYTLEMARARDFAKPNWYLPVWYANTSEDAMRFENLASFALGIQGIMTPPPCEPTQNAGNIQGSVEANHAMQRLGTVFTVGIPQTRQPVALLYSMSNNHRTQVADMDQNYAHAIRNGQWSSWLYLASKMAQHSFTPVLDEDVLDGTLATHHKAVIVAGVDYVDPAVDQALEQFVRDGGKVFVIDSKVEIDGAQVIDIAMPKLPDEDKPEYKAAMQARRYQDLAPFQTASKYMEGAQSLAETLKTTLDGAGFKPLVNAEGGVIAPWVFDAGEIDYLFLANATPKPGGAKNNLAAAVSKISLNGEGGATYDAFRGGEVPELAQGGEFRFGPGQVRAIAIADRPIGSVRTSTPHVVIDYTVEDAPITVQIGATLLDNQNKLLSAAAPLRVQLIDPLGEVRYDLYRATRQGVLNETLPLAANDPGGEYRVVVTDLLANTSDTATFTYRPAPRGGAVAGTTPRAVMFEDEFDNIYRFFKTQTTVTIVPGRSAFNQAAAERLIKTLAPWGVKCEIMSLDEASKARSLSESEARTWVGLEYAGRGQVKPGSENSPVISGYAVQGAVILLGNPEDNDIIKQLQASRFLPYAPKKDELPGRGRGYLAWQRDGVGPGQESVTVIAYDEAGMSEAAGTLYEIAAGIKPLTRWNLPAGASVTPAAEAVSVRKIEKPSFRVRLSDRITGINTQGGVKVLSHDGSITTIADGKAGEKQTLDADAYAQHAQDWATPKATAEQIKKYAAPGRRVKFVIGEEGGDVGVAYWGGLFRIYSRDGNVEAEIQLEQDITAAAEGAGGVILGLANGEVVGIN